MSKMKVLIDNKININDYFEQGFLSPVKIIDQDEALNHRKKLEDAEKKRSARAFDTLYDQLVGLLAGRARVDPILEALGGVAIAGVIGVASWQVASGQMKTSDVIGFITALVMLVRPPTQSNMSKRLSHCS